MVNSAEDVLWSRMDIKIEKRLSFLDKTLQEIDTPEGKKILATSAAIAAYFGFDPKIISFAAYAAKLLVDKDRTKGEAYYFSVKAPGGYTICKAQPSNPRGAYRGIETSRGSTFNSTIYRPEDDAGGALWLYAVVPEHTYTTRLMATLIFSS
jgi:hypothetical protein